MINALRYRVALRLGDAYGKEKKGYLASSRIRGHWLARHWPECDDCFYPEEFPSIKNDFFNPYSQFSILKDYEAVIFNKTYEWRLAKMLKENSQIVIVDFCDPDFLLSHSSRQRVNDCLATLKYTDLAVANGQAIKKELKKIYSGPIEIIPDRIDLDTCYPQKEQHNLELKTIVWYGYPENLRVLEPYLKGILNMGLDITIISDKFFDNFFLVGCKVNPKDHITFKVWHPETFNKWIVFHDVVFIGRDKDKYLSKFKSNNRAVQGWALGMPVAFDIKDLKKLRFLEKRIANVREGQQLVRRYYNIKQSVWQYDRIIMRLLSQKVNGKEIR